MGGPGCAIVEDVSYRAWGTIIVVVARIADTVSVQVVPYPPVKQVYFFAPSTVRPGAPLTASALPVDINVTEVPAPPGEAACG